MGWHRRQFCALFGTRHRCRTVSVQRGGHQTERVFLRETTAFVWHGYLPSLQPGQLYGYRVHGPGTPARIAVQSRQAADRSLCASHFRQDRLGQAHLPLPIWRRRRRPPLRHSRQRRRHAEVRRRQPLLRLGARPAAAHAAQRFDHLRDAREGLQHAEPDIPAGLARHLCRAGLAASLELPEEAGHHRGRADAGARVRRRQALLDTRPAQLLGLQHHQLLRPEAAVQFRRAIAARRWRSSRRW